MPRGGLLEEVGGLVIDLERVFVVELVDIGELAHPMSVLQTNTTGNRRDSVRHRNHVATDWIAAHLARPAWEELPRSASSSRAPGDACESVE